MHLVTRVCVLLWPSAMVLADYSSQGQCTPAQQREALVDANSCEPRPTLINLREHLSNVSGVIQVEFPMNMNKIRNSTFSSS